VQPVKNATVSSCWLDPIGHSSGVWSGETESHNTHPPFFRVSFMQILSVMTLLMSSAISFSKSPGPPVY